MPESLGKKCWTYLQLGSSAFSLLCECPPQLPNHKSFLQHLGQSAMCGAGSLCQEILLATWQTSPWVDQLSLADEQHHPGQIKGWISSANPRLYHLGATRGSAWHTTSFRVGWSLSDVTTAGDDRRKQYSGCSRIHIILCIFRFKFR